MISKNVFLKALLIIMCLCSISVNSQEYKLMAKNTEIGTLYITHSQNNGNKHIKVHSDVLVKFLGETKVKYELNNEYKEDVLIHSKVTTYVNGKLHSDAELEMEGSGYVIVRDGHKSTVSTKATYTAAMLYTKEPIGVSYVFSEKAGLNKEIKKIAPHHYELLTEGKKNQSQEYIYENGTLKKAIINHPIITFYLIKI